MQRRAYVKRAIETFLGQNSFLFVDYSNWYVGVTADPDKRYAAHGSPSLWRDWQTNHPDHARDLEKLFLDLGMKGACGGGTRTKYIYVYKHSGPFS